MNQTPNPTFIPRAPMVMVATIVISAVGLWPSATSCRTETLLDPIDPMHPVTAEGVTVTARGASVKAMVVEKCVFFWGGVGF